MLVNLKKNVMLSEESKKSEMLDSTNTDKCFFSSFYYKECFSVYVERVSVNY